MPRATVLAGSYERFVFGYAHARGAASDASDGATTTTLAKRFTVGRAPRERQGGRVRGRTRGERGER